MLTGFLQKNQNEVNVYFGKLEPIYKVQDRLPSSHSQAGVLIVIHKYHEARHSGRDSHQAILPDALRVNANLFQTDLCRNPDYMDVFKLAIHGTG